jgi:hypothetical protein
MRAQLAEEREARRRADTIIAQLTQANATLAQRVPELEVPTEQREGPMAASEEPDKGKAPRAAGALTAPFMVAGVLRARVRQ